MGDLRRRKAPKVLVSLFERRFAFLASVLLVAIFLSALLAPWIAPHDPGTIGKLDIANRMKPPAFQSGGNWSYPLGTDSMGNDILSRLMFAGRVSLLIGFAAVAIAGFVGLVLGLAAGYFGRWVDDALMRLADVQLSLPPLLLAIFLMAILGAGIWNVIAVLALSAWVGLARVVRGQVLSLREKEFVEAARTIGTSDFDIMFRHILPNTIAPAIVISSFALAGAIITESALSFLGLGVEPTTPTWGGMLADGREYLTEAWWLGFFPGAILTLTVLSINTLGDWLRDYLDPRLKL